ncbi:MAG: L-threonylcarbamoyladenylate synthase, partial [Deferribacterota bacterium]|nr:L-threonylcarbamoyladenylate synthase [Deferribacterota bacterium]
MLLLLKANAENLERTLRFSNDIKKPIIFPSDTIYGIGASIYNIEANKFIFSIKFRNTKKAFPILIGSINQLKQLVVNISDIQYKIIKKLWPGPYTLIFRANKHINNMYTEEGKIALRLPDSDWIINALDKVNTPITATSANISNTPYIHNFKHIYKTFKNHIFLYLYSPCEIEKLISQGKNRKLNNK